jgi:hypothetical protein
MSVCLSVCIVCLCSVHLWLCLAHLLAAARASILGLATMIPYRLFKRRQTIMHQAARWRLKEGGKLRLRLPLLTIHKLLAHDRGWRWFKNFKSDFRFRFPMRQKISRACMAIFGFIHLHILSLTWSQQRDDSHSLPMLSEQREPRWRGASVTSS